MRNGPRKAVLPPHFVDRFTNLFPPNNPAYASINRRVAAGLADEVARFLFSQSKKFSAAEVLAQIQHDGIVASDFVTELQRQRDIDDLYAIITNLIRSLPTPT